MKNYDPEQISVVIGGSIIKNWNTIVVEFDEERWTFKSGTKGEVTRAKNLNKLGRIGITMDISSDDNDTLSAFFVSDAVVTGFVKDNNGTTIFTMPEGTVAGAPSTSLEKETTEREWNVRGKIVDPVVIGGSNTAS